MGKDLDLKMLVANSGDCVRAEHHQLGEVLAQERALFVRAHCPPSLRQANPHAHR
jgi:hypothetical protein